MNDAVTIIGSGALACVLAYRIALAGYSVCLFDSWKEAVNAISEHGVRVVDSSGNIKSISVKAISNPNKIKKIQNALVLVKSWQTTQAAEFLKSRLEANGVCLSLQNGLGNKKILADHLGAKRVFAGTAVLGAKILSPGVVQFAGEKEITLEAAARLDQFARILDFSAFKIIRSKDLAAVQWSKLIANSAINPLTALLECKNGDLLNNELLFSILEKLVCETSTVAKSLGVKLPYQDPLAYTIDVLKATSDNSSSMLQDILRGAETEVDWINGEIVRIGEKAGVEVSQNKLIWELIKAKVSIKKSEKKISEKNNENSFNNF